MAWLLRTHVLHGDTAPFASDCASRARNDIQNQATKDIQVVCLHAGTKQHVKGITAPPRMIRLCPVDTARCTVKPRTRKRTVSANLCSVFTNMPLATLGHKTCPPVLAHDETTRTSQKQDRSTTICHMFFAACMTSVQPLKIRRVHPHHNQTERMEHHRARHHHLNMKQTNRNHGEPARRFRRTVPQTHPVKKYLPWTENTPHRSRRCAQKPTMGATTNQTRCVVSTTSSPNKQDSRYGCARTVGETTPTASCPLQAATTWSCLGTGWRGFSAHMSCMVTLRPLPQIAPLVREKTSKKPGDERHSSCLSACGHKTAGINARPRVIRLYAVDTARSTIKPRPQKRTVSANPCSVFTNMPFATLSHKRAHLYWRTDALPMNWHPIWNGERVCATNGIQRRRDNQRKTDEATCAEEKTTQPAIKLSTPKCASTKNLSTHMMPTIIRWTQLARVTHKN